MASKRENGAGSVYKRSDAKYRPWVAVAPAGFELGGNQKASARRVILGRYATRAEARRALEEYTRNPTEKINFTLRQLYAEWSTHAFTTISRQTVDNYKAAWDKICTGQPEIADERIRDITTGDLRAALAYWQDGQAGKALSFSYISKIKALLTQLWSYALENDIVNKNYAKLVKLKDTGPKTKKRALTDLEFATLEQHWRDVPGGDACYALCYLGFRVSEFCALTRFSYDPKAQTLTGGLKTDAGRGRIVPIHPKIQPIVAAWAARGCDTLYADDQGRPYNKDKFRRRVWRPCMEALGLPADLTPHSARHTCGTRLSAAGAATEDIKAILGHEDYSMTANTYINQDVSTLKSAVNLVD